MANPHKGEVSFKSGDTDYTLRISINTMCELDDALKVEDAFNTLFVTGKATLKQLRTAFFLALRKQHPEIEDEEQAADLVTLNEMMRLLTQAVERHNPPEEEGGVPRPQTEAGQESQTGPAS